MLRHVTGLLSALVLTVPAFAQPLGTGFTYQGELGQNGVPASGLFDMRFRLMDALTAGNAVGPELCVDDIQVANGRFSIQLDFGTQFAGNQRFLEVRVRADTGQGCTDATGLTELSPRQEITPTPEATHALTAGDAVNASQLNGQSSAYFTNAGNLTGTLPSTALGGTYTGTLNLTNAGNVIAGNGEGLVGLSASNISAGSLAAMHMPTDWAASGDLTGFFPSPAIAPGAVTDSKISDLSWSKITGVPENVREAYSPWTHEQEASDGWVSWGSGDISSELPPPPPGLTYTAVKGSDLFTAAIVSDGTMRVWDLGWGLRNVLPPLPPGVTYTSVGGGVLHMLATRSDGTAVGWGYTAFGVASPPPPPPGLGYTKVAGGYQFSIGLLSNGTVIVWGNTANGLANVPALPPGVQYTALAGGVDFALALRSDGVVVGWGNNDSGQLNVPAPPPGVVYTSVGAGYAHCLAVRSDGVAVTWGQGSYGECDIPPPPAGTTYVDCDAGINLSALLCSDGSLTVSGINSPGISTPPVLGPGDRYLTVTACSNRLVARRQVLSAVATSAQRVSAGTFAGSGTYLTALNAGNLSTGTIANNRTTGVSGPAANTLVLRDGSGNFSAGTITATLTGTASNATQLGGQAASFYLNASNIASGTLSNARLTSNVALRNADNAFTSTGVTSFAGNIGIATTSPIQALDINGRLNVRGGIIQDGGTPLTSTTDLGLYSQRNGFFMRFVTTAGEFHWSASGGAGASTLMTLSPNGNLNVTGSLSKGGGSFKIDHPLDPENKFLYHSFVESPDMMNIYNGNAVTDEHGLAVVTMPDYFEALNRDFRYQLTVVDDGEEFVAAKVYRRIGADAARAFTIRTSAPNTEVSWQVTGIRRDAWAEMNRIPTVVEKSGAEKGRYLHPKAFGKPEELGVMSADR